MLLSINRTTVARKLIKLAAHCRLEVHAENLRRSKATVVEFDDLETFVHTKLKPYSVTAAVEGNSRRILGFTVSSMPAKGLLVKKSLRKYGPLVDERPLGRKTLFEKIKPLIYQGALIKSDSNPHYAKDVKKHFPHSAHVTCLGLRGAITGQGELKAKDFDPLFSLNHTYAMFRYNICSLIRKTWCTSKKAERLRDRISLYVEFHNFHLLKN